MGKIYDKEIRLECDCGEPWHFIHIGLIKPREKYWPGPTLTFSMELFYGSFWKRLKHAFKHLFRGWSKVAVNAYVEDYDTILKFALFMRDCIDELDKPEEDPEIKKVSIIYYRDGKEYLIQEGGCFTAKKTLEEALLEAGKQLGGKPWILKNHNFTESILTLAKPPIRDPVKKGK